MEAPRVTRKLALTTASMANHLPQSLPSLFQIPCRHLIVSYPPNTSPITKQPRMTLLLPITNHVLTLTVQVNPLHSIWRTAPVQSSVPTGHGLLPLSPLTLPSQWVTPPITSPESYHGNARENALAVHSPHPLVTWPHLPGAGQEVRLDSITTGAAVPHRVDVKITPSPWHGI